MKYYSEYKYRSNYHKRKFPDNTKCVAILNNSIYFLLFKNNWACSHSTKYPAIAYFDTNNYIIKKYYYYDNYLINIKSNKQLK